MNLRNSVDELIKGLIIDCNPYETVKKCLAKHQFNDGNIYVVAIGKAAYTMALGAKDSIPNIHAGVVISKYKHILSDIAGFKCFEAGHPIMDENTIIATNYVLDLTSNLKVNDEVIFLISGGGSALFESPKIALKDLQDINNQLLKSGANINEINIIRKRLSNVKAGRFAEHCAPSKVTSIILSDVIGNDLSSIASGPSVVDYSSYEDAINIVNKYSIKINDEIKKLLLFDTPKELFNVENKVIGSVDILCENAKNRLTDLGYQVSILDTKATQDVDEISRKKLGCTLIATFGTESTKSAILTACRGYRSEDCPNGIDIDEAKYIIKRDTRHFAKRQLTWFRREKDVIWLDKTVLNNDEMILNKIEDSLKKKEIIC